MPSKSCAVVCGVVKAACVKNLTVPTHQLCFLLSSVFLKNYLTQFVAVFYAGSVRVFTSLKGGLYTLNTALTTNTIYINNFYYSYCSGRI